MLKLVSNLRKYGLRGCKLCWGGDFPVSLLWVNSMHLSFASNPYYSTTTRKIHHPPWLLNSCNFSSELDKKWATTRAHKLGNYVASCDKFLLGAFNHRWIWRCLESLDCPVCKKVMLDSISKIELSLALYDFVGMSGPTELLQKPEPKPNHQRALQWRRQQGCHTQWGSRRALRLMTQLMPLCLWLSLCLTSSILTQIRRRRPKQPNAFDTSKSVWWYIWLDALDSNYIAERNKFLFNFHVPYPALPDGFPGAAVRQFGFANSSPNATLLTGNQDVLPCHSVSIFINLLQYTCPFAIFCANPMGDPVWHDAASSNMLDAQRTKKG